MDLLRDETSLLLSDDADDDDDDLYIIGRKVGRLEEVKFERLLCGKGKTCLKGIFYSLFWTKWNSLEEMT